MGPKKRTGTATEATAQSKKPTQRPTSEPQQFEDSLRFLPPVLTPDNWTEEQEITLFKAIIKWKPAGMHKHFRMLSIANLMKNHGVADTHTNIQGIWAKLATLYNLEAADDQEEMLDDGDQSPTPTMEFDLPDDYYDIKMLRRFRASPSPESEEEDKPAKPTPVAIRKAATTKPKKETKAEATRRGAKRRKVEEEEQKDDGGEEAEEYSDEEMEEGNSYHYTPYRDCAG
ncbi:hypothetical protein ABW21_db0208649 [Orbilia brochopaga]|nr:hypothetical protein ABW21_db0208649 [Drechslerella brochopaga]